MLLCRGEGWVRAESSLGVVWGETCLALGAGVVGRDWGLGVEIEREGVRDWGC